MDKEFYNIEGKQLDKEQIESVEYIGSYLVIAGAGAGKTLSIVGKIKYLLEEKKIKPSEILVLAFTDKVVNELIERIGKVTDKKIDILTFHKLGLRIFNKSDNHKDIDIDAFNRFIFKYFYKGEYEENVELASIVYNYINQDYNNYNLVAKEKIHELTENINKVTLNNEKANSVVALIVCNMLYVNNINYEYVVENKYSHYIRIDDKVIHFTKQIMGSNNLSLKNADFHNITRIIYNYLQRIGIDIICYSDYKKYLNEPGAVKRFEIFVESLIQAQKIACAADIYDQDFDELIDRYCKKETRTIMFFNIFRELRKVFAAKLKEEFKTDFEYMINGPIEILKRNQFLPYKYIIVDEYQDISPARHNLLVEVLNQKDGYLMAYGDDWQSIYSFSGSNNEFFMKFTSNEKLKDSKEFYLKNTYRNSQQLIDASSDFIMKNPCQKSKNIYSNKCLEKPIKILKYNISNLDSLIYTLDYIKNLEKNNVVSLMVLGRTNNAINMLREIPEMKFEGNDEYQRSIYYYEGYQNIKIQFLTIHRSKGLEADYVFVTGVNEKDMPLEVNPRNEHISILSKFNQFEEEKEHEKYEGLPSSEERRLFYVALTRSKNIVFVSVPNLKTLAPSIFIDDIKTEALEYVYIEKLYNNTYLTCPECGGMIREVSKKGRVYRFCENKCKI